MFTSDNRDNIDNHSFLGLPDLFPSYQVQREVHLNHHHHQLSLFNLPTSYHLPSFAEDQFDYDPGWPVHDADHDLDLITFHHQQQLQQQEQNEQQGEAAMGFVSDSDGNDKVVSAEVEKRAVVAPGRSWKKDRHSKITTSRGPRDRRMRLSLEVAREFFDLQDMLGFDKASKTVGWLISQSKSAINEIIRKVKGNDRIAASYTSDCEIGFNRNSDGDDGGRAVESSAGRKRSKKERKARQSRRDCHQRLGSATRESRMKARDRAKERTLEKMWNRTLEGSSLNNPWKPCSSLVEAGEESSCIQGQTATTGSNLEIFTQYEEIAGMAGRMSIDVSSSDLVYGKWSPAAASSSNLNLPEMGVPQSHQLRSCEQFFKQWEAFSNYGFDPS